MWSGLALFIFGFIVLTREGLRRAKTLDLETTDARVELSKRFRWSIFAGLLLLNAGIWVSAFLPGRPVASPILEFVGMAVMLISLEELP